MNRDYHKFEDCPWTGVNDPMCWLCFRYTMGFKDAITAMNNGVQANDDPLVQSVLRRHGTWGLNLELARWERGFYPDKEGHIRDCQGASCGATCECPCHAMPGRGCRDHAEVPHRLSGLLMPWVLVPADLQALSRIP